MTTRAPDSSDRYREVTIEKELAADAALHLLCVIASAALVIAFCIGFIIGHYGRN